MAEMAERTLDVGGGIALHLREMGASPRHVPEAGHWIQHDLHELVNDELVRFLG